MIAPMTTPGLPNPPLHSIDPAPYAGRWIAVVRDYVAAVALTPNDALLAAKLSRPKDEPIIVFVPMDIRDTLKG
jgi:hypothetical protein